MIQTIDLRDLHVAPLIIDAETEAIYGGMTKLAGAISARLTPKSDRLMVYSDGVLGDVVDYTPLYDLEFNLSDFSLEDQALILGHSVVGGVLQVGALDQAPWMGIAFRAQKSNKKWRYIKMLKAKFIIPDEEVRTREEKLTAGTATVKAICVNRIYDDKLQWKTDEDMEDYNPATGLYWFNSFDSSDSNPPTLSSITPALNATAVSTGTTVKWVFSEPIQPSCVTEENFMLLKDSDGVPVAGTLSQNSTKTTVTFTPSAALSAAAYRPVYTKGVKDLAGNPIAKGSASKFTCS